MSYSDRFAGYAEGVIAAPLDERLAFIRKTYLHVTGAMAAFIGLSYVFFQMSLGLTILTMVQQAGRFGALAFFGGFALLGWLGSTLAHSSRSLPTQYGALAFYTLIEAVIFAPILFIVGKFMPDVLPTAAVITLVTFVALSAFTLITRQDFSFMRNFLVVTGFVALGAIGCSFLFGFQLGIWFSAAMILFASGTILYTTSRVLHEYETDQYVAAALELFAAVAMLFYYVLRFLMQLQRR